MRTITQRFGMAVRGGDQPVSTAAGAVTSAILAALSVSMVAGGVLLQRVFDIEVLGPLALLLWPGYALGAMLLFFGIAGFVTAVVSGAATVSVAAVRAQRQEELAAPR